MTLLHLLAIVLPIGGLGAGLLLGLSTGDLWTALADGIAGFVIGATIGVGQLVCLPRVFNIWLQRLSRAGICDRIHSHSFISANLIAELVRRGEPMDTIRLMIAGQLSSPDSVVSHFGRENAR